MTFEPDTITRAVQEEVDQMAGTVGSAWDFNLAVDRAGARAVFEDFVQKRLGPNVLGLRTLNEEERMSVREEVRQFLAGLGSGGRG